MEYEDTETSWEISTLWKFELNSHWLLFSKHQVDQYQATSELSLCSQGYHRHSRQFWGFWAKVVYVSSTIHVIWICSGTHITGYYSSPPCSSFFSFPLSIFFSLSMMRRRGRRLPFSCVSIIPLSVSPSGLIGVWETLVSSQWAQPEQWRPI